MPADTACASVRSPAALLWDFDGTLVDSEPSWHAAENRLLLEWGAPPLDAAANVQLVGMALVDAAALLLRHAGRDDTRVDHWAGVLNEYALAAMVRDGVPFRPGAAELLEQAREAGVPCALVSMSYRSILTPVLDTLPPGSFAVIISGDQVERGKPHPEPYLRAASALGVDPVDCLVLEDSIPGTLSAQQAGMPTLGIPFEQDLTPGPLRVVVPSLLGLSLVGASKLWREILDA